MKTEAAALCLLLAAATRGVFAQEAEPSLLHWAYAATFGTGVYQLGDDVEALVVKLPLSWTWFEADPARRCLCGVKFLFPVTVGVQAFDLGEILAGQLPDRVEQVSFLPGVELEFPRSERWTLRLSGQLGWGTETSGLEQAAWIYTGGIRSRYAWPTVRGKPALINGLQWSGYDPKDGPRQSMSKLTTGAEFDVPVPRWQFRGEAMHLMPHALGDWYVNPLDLFSIPEEQFEDVDVEWEVGLAAGRERPFSVLGFKFDRVGFGLRFSEESRGVRFFLGSIF